MTWVVTRPVVRLSPHELTHSLINYCGQLAYMEFFARTHSILEHIPHHLKKETACQRFVPSFAGQIGSAGSLLWTKHGRKIISNIQRYCHGILLEMVSYHCSWIFLLK